MCSCALHRLRPEPVHYSLAFLLNQRSTWIIPISCRFLGVRSASLYVRSFILQPCWRAKEKSLGECPRLQEKNRRMKKLLLSFLGLSMALMSQAQYQTQPGEYPGRIIQKKGELKGYIILNGSEMSPWGNQTSVKFFTEDAAADGKVKGKEKQKFKPKDISGYDADGRYFESMKISASKLSMGVGLMQLRFVERLVDGNVKLYKFYESPAPVSATVGEEEKIKAEQELERMRNNPLYVIKKGSGPLTLVDKINLSQFLADCPEVKEKYESGGYGVEPWNNDAKSKVGKMLARSVNAKQVLAVLPEILNDYNNCKK